MKKVICFITTCIVSFLLVMPSVSATDTVNVYLFRGEGCPHCEDEMEFLDSIQKDYPYMHVIKYEIWENPDNAALADKVKARIDSSSKGVPFLVIGDKSFTGFDESRKTDIRRALEYYETEKAPDIVADVLNGIPEKEKKKIEKTENPVKDESIDWENVAVGGIVVLGLIFIVYLYYNTKIRK